MSPLLPLRSYRPLVRIRSVRWLDLQLLQSQALEYLQCSLESAFLRRALRSIRRDPVEPVHEVSVVFRREHQRTTICIELDCQDPFFVTLKSKATVRVEVRWVLFRYAFQNHTHSFELP